MGKVLIAYFSRKGNNYVSGNIVNLAVGNTEIAAKEIQSLVGGELFEMQTEHPYSEDYHKCTEEAKKELHENLRPKLVGSVSDMDKYDVIYLGYPNWWGTMPMAVFTFLEEYNFTAKTIVPFCTHEGSGMGRSENDIKRLCPQSTIARGLAIHGTHIQKSKSQIGSWLETISKS